MNKPLIITFFCLVLAMIIFFGLWRSASNDLKVAKDALRVANDNITTLQQDNKKLVAFIEQKDLEIKELEKEYTDRLKNIPKDSCGDSKPSADLLKYLRKNAQ